MRYLVAGASGFIGQAIVKAIKQNNPDSLVTGLSRHRPKSQDDIDLYVTCDLSQEITLESEFDVVINASGEANYELSAAELERSHRQSSRNLMTWANTKAVGRYIHISTASIYLRRGDVSFVDETNIPENLFNQYAKVKRLVEIDLESGFEAQGLFIIRPRMVIGPGDKSWMPAIQDDLESPIIFLSDNLIQPTSVNHLASSVVHLANLPTELSGTYNVCGAEVLRVRDLIEPLIEGRKLVIPWPKQLGKAVLKSGMFKTTLADHLFHLSCDFTMDCAKITRTGLPPQSESASDMIQAYLNS